MVLNHQNNLNFVSTEVSLSNLNFDRDDSHVSQFVLRLRGSSLLFLHAIGLFLALEFLRSAVSASPVPVFTQDFTLKGGSFLSSTQGTSAKLWVRSQVKEPTCCCCSIKLSEPEPL
ncbi:hypothetical protein ATANTOWER_013577 [Ataeniobius toweri]|uniref:Uncharacterized protein n=1 Tax=Ataeniobius toweri TaxID=208326 RepID=A0ABU7C1S3_9TELE|nr:hypothetical protein [Ataeniobius toweri]